MHRRGYPLRRGRKKRGKKMLKPFQAWITEAYTENAETEVLHEALQYHLAAGLSVCESVFRPGSLAHQRLIVEARAIWETGEIDLSSIDQDLFGNTDLGLTAQFEGRTILLDFPIFEAEYQGKTVEIGKPKRGGAKKYHVYVKNPATGKVKKIAFGDVHGGLTAKVSNPAARKSFAARHQCHLKKDRMSAGYWACRINRYAHLWGGKTYPGFW